MKIITADNAVIDKQELKEVPYLRNDQAYQLCDHVQCMSTRIKITIY